MMHFSLFMTSLVHSLDAPRRQVSRVSIVTTGPSSAVISLLPLHAGCAHRSLLPFFAAGLEAHFPLGLHHLALLHSASAFGSCLNDFVDVVFDSSALDWSIRDHGALISFGHLRDASRFRRLRRAFATNLTSFNDFNVVLGCRECDNGRKDEELSHG